KRKGRNSGSGNQANSIMPSGMGKGLAKILLAATVIIGAFVLWRQAPTLRVMWLRFSAPPMLQEFSLPYQNPVAICFSNDKTAWIADWVTGSINKHKVDRNLSLRGNYPAPGGHPTGIAWDGANLWSCNSWERKIYRHNLDDKLSIEDSYPSPN